jgi:hypothetical protein
MTVERSRLSFAVSRGRARRPLVEHGLRLSLRDSHLLLLLRRNSKRGERLMALELAVGLVERRPGASGGRFGSP